MPIKNNNIANRCLIRTPSNPARMQCIGAWGTPRHCAVYIYPAPNRATLPPRFGTLLPVIAGVVPCEIPRLKADFTCTQIDTRPWYSWRAGGADGRVLDGSPAPHAPRCGCGPRVRRARREVLRRRAWVDRLKQRRRETGEIAPRK